jgi:hypothetical protein
VPRSPQGIEYHRRPNWQHIGNEIDAAMIFARVDFINVYVGYELNCG